MVPRPNRDELLPKDELAKLSTLLDSERELREIIQRGKTELQLVNRDVKHSIMKNLGHYAMFKGKAIRVEFKSSEPATRTRDTMIDMPAGWYQLDSIEAVQLPNEMARIANLVPFEPGDIARFGVLFDQLFPATLAEINAVERQKASAR